MFISDDGILLQFPFLSNANDAYSFRKIGKSIAIVCHLLQLNEVPDKQSLKTAFVLHVHLL